MSHADTSAFRLSTAIPCSAALFIGRCFPSSLTLSISLLPVYRLWRHTRVPVPLEQGKPHFSRASTVSLPTIVRGTVNALGNKKSQLQLSPVMVPLYRRGDRLMCNWLLLIDHHVNSCELTCAGGKCQSGGVKKVHNIHATIVKSITPIPINIPAASKVKIMVSIICFVLL